MNTTLIGKLAPNMMNTILLTPHLWIFLSRQPIETKEKLLFIVTSTQTLTNRIICNAWDFSFKLTSCKQEVKISRRIIVCISIYSYWWRNTCFNRILFRKQPSVSLRQSNDLMRSRKHFTEKTNSCNQSKQLMQILH